MTRNSVSRPPYFRNHTSYDHYLWYNSIKWYFHAYFLFFKVLIFRVVRRVKKWFKMTKKTRLCLISQEPYIIWSSFMVHVRRKIISLCLLLHFSEIFFFGVSSGVKGQKMANLYLYISRTVDHIIKIFSTQV